MKNIKFTNLERQNTIDHLESEDFEDAIRNAVSIGGDSDTIACIAGGIAEAYYKDIPEHIWENTVSYFDNEMKLVVDAFYDEFIF